MNRVVLIHWNATEAQQHTDRLRAGGYQTELFPAQGGATALGAIRANPPDAFVIDLSRLPSQGRAVAIALRQQKATRSVPIVFVAGQPNKVADIRAALPDAAYTSWGRIRSALKRAIGNPPETPVVPGTMDAYSATPLATKLGIKPGSVVALLGAPVGFERNLGPLRKQVRIRTRASGPSDLILLFAKSRADLDRRLPPAERRMSDKGSVWIAWPKKTSGVPTDLTQTVVRQTGLAADLVDYKICAIDDIWSALRFARRRARNKPGRR